MKFSRLSQYFQKLENTASRLEMTEILSNLFSDSHQDEVAPICYLLQGRVVPLYEAVEFGIADKFMIRAIAQACGLEGAEVLAIFKQTGDLGDTAEKLKTQNPELNNAAKNMEVTDVFGQLDQIARTGGTGSQDKKIEILADLLSGVDGLSARYIVRIPLGKLRLGFSAMTILDGLSWMLKGDKSLRPKLEEAYNVRPDLGYIASTLKKDGLAGLAHVKAKVGAPILAALCQRLDSATEMIRKMGEVDVEPKYDGVRAQLHIKKNSGGIWVGSYSRNLENTSDMFPELHTIADQVKAESVILDSEAVGFDPKTGKILAFQETTTRKRKHDISLFSQSVPLKFFVFDILNKDGVDLLSTPLSRRREILEETVMPGPVLELSPHIVTSDNQLLRNYHREQLAHGLEGVVVKKWSSFYEPGRRGYNWVKFKETEGQTGKLDDTIDGVVMGYYKGEGKRTQFGIGAFLLGVADGDNFVTVTKIGTGVTDEMWAQLLSEFNKYKTGSMPKAYKDVNKSLLPDVWIEPAAVVEVAGDDLTQSPIHGAGFALRFPRLVRVRKDKSPSQATTKTEIAEFYKLQSGNHREKP